jgi:WD40 repeat protein
MRCIQRGLVCLGALAWVTGVLATMLVTTTSAADPPADKPPPGLRLRLKPSHPEVLFGVDPQCSITFSPDGRRVAKALSGRDRTGPDGGWITIWDARTGEEVQSLHYPNGELHRVAFTPNGSSLVTLGVPTTTPAEGFLSVWDVASGEQTWSRGWAAGTMLLAPDGRTVAGDAPAKDGLRYQAIALLELSSGGIRQELGGLTRSDGKSPPGSVGAWSFSPDSRYLAGTFNENEQGQFVAVWELASGKIVRRIEERAGVTFSPDGRTLAVFRFAPTPDSGETVPDLIRLHDASTGKVVRRFRGDLREAHAQDFVLFSPDGRLLATATRELPLIWVWDVGTGKVVAKIRTGAREGGVQGLAFSPDGQTLASDGLLLWDLTAFPDVKDVKPPKPPDAPPAEEEKPLSAEDATKAWDDLASDDAARAYQGMWALALHPKAGLPLLRDRLKPAEGPDPKKLAAWLADLESDDFDTRSKAKAGLSGVAELIAPQLRKLRKETDPKNKNLRKELEEVLQAAGPTLSGLKLQGVRAVEALEHVGSDDARALLRQLAKGLDDAPTTRAAKEALARLEKKAP